MSSPHLKAVIFDIGGVVMRSPFIGIAKYEAQNGLPENYINCLIVARGHHGAWQKFERGELELQAFYKAFSQDLSDAEVGNKAYSEYCGKKGIVPPTLPETVEVNGRELFSLMMRESSEYDPHIREALVRLKAVGKHKVIALTNNFGTVFVGVPQEELDFLGVSASSNEQLARLFDDYCDSSILGMRKPEPAFYLAACKRNGIDPQDAIFLDDIPMNLKAARKLGMETIHVPIGGTLAAVKQLEGKLGLDLTGSGPSPPAARL